VGGIAGVGHPDCICVPPREPLSQSLVAGRSMLRGWCGPGVDNGGCRGARTERDGTRSSARSPRGSARCNGIQRVQHGCHRGAARTDPVGLSSVHSLCRTRAHGHSPCTAAHTHRWPLSLRPRVSVLIVDWDVHHGNGIQHAFESDPSVLYFSVHRYEKGLYFPSADMGIGSDGAPTSAGSAEGLGTSINVGWNTKGRSKPGDAEYRAVWREILMPVAHEFAPDLVIVAAGFDAAEGDPIGKCNMTPECYASLTRDLMTLAGGKLVLALEGGYSLSATAVSAAACMEALLGIRCGLPRFDPPLQQHSACESQVLKPCFLADEGPDLRRDGRESPAAPDLLLAPFLRPLNKRSHPPARFRLASNQIARAITTKSANDDECDKGARKALEETRVVHAVYWRCLRNPSEGR